MEWAEVDIYTTTEGIDVVTGTLTDLGVSGFVIKDSADFEEFLADKTGNWDYIDDDLMGLKNCETTVTLYIPKNEDGAVQLAAVRSAVAAIKAADTEGRFGRLEIETSSIRDEDWANNWKQYFKPIEIGEKLLIKPSWEDIPDGSVRKVLEIDPASSFGTGQHNTTRLCLELIEKHISSGDRVLDLGCGSGILSVGAMLLGAEYVKAVDITDDSMRITRENMEKNGIPEQAYGTQKGDITSDSALRAEIGTGSYDLVCANIVADVLIAMSPYFGEFLKQDGRLIISGIIDARLDEVLETVKAQGFELIEQRNLDDWNAAYFRRSGSI
ncbi:MAG: 50S ribosomal protein L11 methyltransferase [Ruminococcus sp.]|nr:50S ribosomal protein L11 methyltransferase [Ruminococcus sp.]